MSDYSFVLPEDFSDYEGEVTAKGWFSQAKMIVCGKYYRLRFFDPVRLGQEIIDDLEGDRIFFEPNLVVVKSVTRSDMELAADFLFRSGLVESLVAE